MGRRKVAEYSNTQLEWTLGIAIRIASEGIHTPREDRVLNKPLSVERFGHWYYCRGRSKADGTHSSGVEWRFFTRDRALAVKTAKSHIE